MAVRNRLAAAIAHKEMPELTDEKRQCNWCFQQLNCAVAFKAQGGGAATADAFVRPSTDRRGGALDGVQQELGAKYERAAGHMTATGGCAVVGCLRCVMGGGLAGVHLNPRIKPLWSSMGG
jgi:hypothetical protein